MTELLNWLRVSKHCKRGPTHTLSALRNKSTAISVCVIEVQFCKQKVRSDCLTEELKH